MPTTLHAKQETTMVKPKDTEPQTPDQQPLKAFQLGQHDERDIATKIGRTVTAAKEDYQQTANQNGRGREDIAAARVEKRRAVAVKIFREFDMLEKSGEVAFAELYTASERRVESGELSRSDLVESVLSFEQHPVIRTATSLALVVGDRFAKEDAIVVQRASALLLDTIEPPDTWSGPREL